MIHCLELVRICCPLVAIGYGGKTFGRPAQEGLSGLTIVCCKMEAAANISAVFENKKGFLTVAWSQNEIPKCRTTGIPIIVFKDVIKVSIYWGNQWPWHTFFPLRPWWSASFLPRFIWKRTATYLLSSLGRDHRPTQERFLSEICNHSALSKYSVNRDVLLWFLMGSPFWAKQNISVGLGLIL